MACPVRRIASAASAGLDAGHLDDRFLELFLELVLGFPLAKVELAESAVLQAHRALPQRDVPPMAALRPEQPDVARLEPSLLAQQDRSAATELPRAVAWPALEHLASRRVRESQALAQARAPRVPLVSWLPALPEQQV